MMESNPPALPVSAVTPELRADILRQFRLPRHSVHGPAHWARVRYKGLLLSRAGGADWQVVELFSFLHDSQRYDDGFDRDHGPRAADYALRTHGRLFQLSESQLGKLVQACMGHRPPAGRLADARCRADFFAGAIKSRTREVVI